MTTTLLSVAAQQYHPSVYSFNITIAAGADTLDISMTRQNWPAGTVINSISVNDPTGVQVCSANGIEGGAQTDRNGNTLTTQTMEISAADGKTLPAGVYTVLMDVAQTLTTATTITSNP